MKKLLPLVCLLLLLPSCAKEYMVVMSGMDFTDTYSFPVARTEYITEPPKKAASSAFITYTSYIYAAYQMRELPDNWTPLIYEAYPMSGGEAAVDPDGIPTVPEDSVSSVPMLSLPKDIDANNILEPEVLEWYRATLGDFYPKSSLYQALKHAAKK